METLIILAAGLGSRFGGLKQLEPVGPNGELLIHYSIYDAKKAGFNKILFVIRKEMYEDFKILVGDRVKGIEVDYVFQENSDLEKYVSKKRKKPLGTGHAVYCCKDKIISNFAVINSDDFYGYDAFKTLYESLAKNNENFYIMGYALENTLSKNGSVKRGVCDVNRDELVNITESKIEIINNKIIAISLNSEKRIDISNETLVSMGMYGLNSKILKFMRDDIVKFFENQENESAEYFLPEVVKKMIELGLIKTKVLTTDSKWVGMTYKSDLDEVKEKIKIMTKNGNYPENLF